VSLTFLNSLKAGRSRLQRCALHLQGYTFTVKYKAGKRLTSADGLSRRDYPTPPPESPNDALDDDAFFSAIDPLLFADAINERQPLTQTKTVHAINFVYDWSNDTDNCDTTNDTYLPIHVFALSDDTDISDAQRQFPDFKDIIANLEKGSLPDDDIATRRTVAKSEHCTLLDDKLYYLHTPRQKQKSKLQSVTQQLCLPCTLRHCSQSLPRQ